MHLTVRLAALSAIMIGTASTHAEDLAEKKGLTLSISKQIASAAEAFAREHAWNVVIAIVDDGGHLIYLQRMDTTQTGSVNVAIRKAEAAVAFKRPTKVFEDGVVGGRVALVVLPGAIPFNGGIPIMHEGAVLGAIGVSGVTGEQDGMIAQAGADALPQILDN